MGRESTVAGIRWRRLGGGVGSGDGSGGDVWAVASRQWRRLWRWSGQRRCSGSGVTAASLGRWGRLGGCVRSARTAGRESAWVVASSGAVAVIDWRGSRLGSQRDERRARNGWRRAEARGLARAEARGLARAEAAGTVAEVGGPGCTREKAMEVRSNELVPEIRPPKGRES